MSYGEFVVTVGLELGQNGVPCFLQLELSAVSKAPDRVESLLRHLLKLSWEDH